MALRGPRISVIAALRRGQHGWLLRWSEPGPGSVYIHLSHWFADRDEAVAVCHRMRGGATFDQALRALLREVGLSRDPAA